MIPIVSEEKMGPPYERCALCRVPTPMWTDLPDRPMSGQVACCKGCAATALPGDVPTKADWFAAETAARAARP